MPPDGLAYVKFFLLSQLLTLMQTANEVWAFMKVSSFIEFCGILGTSSNTATLYSGFVDSQLTCSLFYKRKTTICVTKRVQQFYRKAFFCLWKKRAFNSLLSEWLTCLMTSQCYSSHWKKPNSYVWLLQWLKTLSELQTEAKLCYTHSSNIAECYLVDSGIFV